MTNDLYRYSICAHPEAERWTAMNPIRWAKFTNRPRWYVQLTETNSARTTMGDSRTGERAIVGTSNAVSVIL